MFLVDTNIVSLLDPRRRHPSSEALLTWMREHENRLHLSVVSVLEIETGRLKLVRLRQFSRADEISSLLARIIKSFDARLLSMDVAVMLEAARILEDIRRETIDLRDVLIAATAKAHGLTVLTRNVKHFRPSGVPTLDPFAELPPDA